MDEISKKVEDLHQIALSANEVSSSKITKSRHYSCSLDPGCLRFVVHGVSRDGTQRVKETEVMIANLEADMDKVIDKLESLNSKLKHTVETVSMQLPHHHHQA